MWLLLLMLQEPVPPRIDFETLKKAESWFAEGHFKTPPPALKDWLGRWVTIEGFFFATFESELKDAFISSEFADPSKGIEPLDPFARVRVDFRSDMIPEDLRTRWGSVSGTFGLRRFERDGKLVAVFHLSDAVEGARKPPPVKVTADRLSFSLLETSRAVAKGEDLEARPYDVQDMGPMPDSILAFHGKWVTLTGHFYVPYPADRIQKFVLAKNPWDGCCFGVPPAAWNMVMIQLKQDVPMEAPYPPLLTASGRFHVEVTREPRSGIITHCFELRDAVVGSSPEPEGGGFPYPRLVGFSLFGVVVIAAFIVRMRRSARRN